MSSASRSAYINRLADPLRGKYSNFDELTSDDEFTMNSHSLVKSARNTTRTPISKHNQKMGTNLLPSNGFFLTESVFNYSDDDFVEEEMLRDSSESINFQPTTEREKTSIYDRQSTKSPKRSISKQKDNRELSHNYDREMESMKQSIGNPLRPMTSKISYAGDEIDIFACDDVLSRLRQRLEEATALESLIKKNQLRDEEYKAKKVKSAAMVRRNQLMSKLPSKVLSKLKNVGTVPAVKRKAWEDTTHNITSITGTSRKRDMQESSNLKKNVDSRFTKSLPAPVLISNRNERIKGNFKESISVSDEFQNRDDINNNMRRQYDDLTYGNSTEKSRNSRVRVKQVRNPTVRLSSSLNPLKQSHRNYEPYTTRFPAIEIKKKTSNTSQFRPKMRNVKIESKSTFITDISSLVFSLDEHEKIIVENRKKKKNRILELNQKVRDSLSRKRKESKSAPSMIDLNNLYRVDEKNNILNSSSERSTKADAKYQEMAPKNIIFDQILKKNTSNNTIRKYISY